MKALSEQSRHDHWPERPGAAGTKIHTWTRVAGAAVHLHQIRPDLSPRRAVSLVTRGPEPPAAPRPEHFRINSRRADRCPWRRAVAGPAPMAGEAARGGRGRATTRRPSPSSRCSCAGARVPVLVSRCHAADRPCRVGSARPNQPGVHSAARPVSHRARGHPRADTDHRNDSAVGDRGRPSQGSGVRHRLDGHAGRHRGPDDPGHRRQTTHSEQQPVDRRGRP